jgi:putative tricarboxylic transport membrane protein
LSRGGDTLKRDEGIAGGLIFLFGLATTLLSLNMPIGTFRMAGTGLFPLCLGVILMILSGIFLLKIFFQEKEIRVKAGPSIESAGPSLQMVLFLGAMVFVTLFFNLWGYPLSAFLLMVFLLRIVGVKKWKLNLSVSLTAAIVCYFLFVQWLKIPLPKGWIGL